MSVLSGRSILLTGASQGIGHALALELAARQTKLALVARDQGRLEETAALCRERGAQVVVLPGDVGVLADCRRVVSEAERAFSGLDALVNNAGMSMMARFEELPDLDVYEQLMRVNYLGCVWLTHSALPALKRSRGRIVVVASLAGLTGVPTRTGYAASKHAVIGFFESLRIELAESGVSVTIACPDFVVSEIHRRSIGPNGRPLGTSPMQEGQLMSAEECARQIVRGMERRERLLVMSARGKLGRFAKLLVPGLIDRIAARAVRRGK